jgi:hypothetical protein
MRKEYAFLKPLSDLDLANMYRDAFLGPDVRRAIEDEALTRMAREWLQEQQPHPFPYGPDNPDPTTLGALPLDDDLPL